MVTAINISIMIFTDNGNDHIDLMTMTRNDTKTQLMK